MAIRPFLAMTAAEMRETPTLPQKAAWMACHFSPYGRGLSNLPRELPANSLLMVDDITPIHGHDPEIITRQLIQCSNTLEFYGILLDFQRAGNPETAELVRYLSDVIPCPLAISEAYAHAADLPVFVSPVPPSAALQEHLSSWTSRKIWLDVSTWGELLTLTEDSCSTQALSPQDFPEEGFPEKRLHCHYKAVQTGNNVRFSLWRTHEDFCALLEEAEHLGIVNAVGLFQEFCTYEKI